MESSAWRKNTGAQSNLGPLRDGRGTQQRNARMGKTRVAGSLEFWRRIRPVLRRRDREDFDHFSERSRVRQRMDEELNGFLEMAADEKVKQGGGDERTEHLRAACVGKEEIRT